MTSPRRWVQLSVFSCLLASAAPAGAQPADPAPVPDDIRRAIDLPPTFRISVYAQGLPGMRGPYFEGPRFMAFDDEGNLYLSLGAEIGSVVMLPDRDEDGKADRIVTVVEGLEAPQGLAFRGDTLLVATTDQVLRLRNPDGRWPAEGYDVVVDGLPGGGRHPVKTLKIGPDGYLYVTAGSSCNVCVEDDPRRGGILRYGPDGRPAGAAGLPEGVFATGLRNPEGFAWHPSTGAMYASNNGTDLLGDTVPPEEINRIVEGGHYGWPYCWGNRRPDLEFGGTEERCRETRGPAITLAAHSAPLGIAFYDSDAFPAEYRGDLFVAEHGSWNRDRPSGYRISRVRFENGSPVRVEAFATGWLADDRRAWGRPVDVVVGPDGALYVSDDRSAMVYRIRYQGEG